MRSLTRAELESKVQSLLVRNDVVVLKKMFDEGLISSDFTIEGLSLLALVAGCPLEQGSSEQVVEYLLSLPDIDVEKPSNSGRVPTLYAARSGQVEILKKLLKNGVGANPNTINPEGDSPLFAACSRPNREKIIDVLLQDPRISVDPHPLLEPLVAAIAGGHLSYVKKLTEQKDIDLTSPRRMQIYRPHDSKKAILIFPIEKKLRTDRGDAFVLNGKLLDFSRTIEEKYGHNGITDYLTERLEQLRRERLERRRSPAGSPRSGSVSSRERELSDPLLDSYYDALYEETLHSDTRSVSSEGGRRDSIDSNDSTSSAARIIRKLAEIKVVSGAHKSKPVKQVLEEKQVNFQAAHDMMMDALRTWHLNSIMNIHGSRPEIFAKKVDPVVRAFNAEQSNQEKFQTMVDTFLSIDVTTLPDCQSTRDFQQLCDVILNAAGKEHELMRTEAELSQLKEKVSPTPAEPDSPRPLISFAPFFKAALQACAVEERAQKLIGVKQID